MIPLMLMLLLLLVLLLHWILLLILFLQLLLLLILLLLLLQLSLWCSLLLSPHHFPHPHFLLLKAPSFPLERFELSLVSLLLEEALTRRHARGWTRGGARWRVLRFMVTRSARGS